MHGPDILARFLAQPGPPDKYGNHWQYHSRSDRHSKVGSWGVALDLLATSSLLRRHAEAGKIVLGVISPVVNNRPLGQVPPVVTRHRQPADTERVLRKVAEISRRSASSESGFDGIGITVLDLRNDGGPVRILSGPPAPRPGDSFHYGSMVVRMANEYDTTFAHI